MGAVSTGEEAKVGGTTTGAVSAAAFQFTPPPARSGPIQANNSQRGELKAGRAADFGD